MPDISPAAFTRAGLRALGLGLGLAIVLDLVPIFRMLFHPLLTIVHELGHTAAGWAFGYPAIPAFDFQFGGGFTALEGEQRRLLVWAGFGLLATAAYRARRSLVTLLTLAGLAALYGWLAFTELAHLAVITTMGHGMELAIAGIFLYRAMSGHAVLQVDERPAYAMAGWFIVLDRARFGLELVTSELARVEYEEAKGGGHWMDFSLLAEDFLRVPLASVAMWFVIACGATVALAWLAFRYQGWLAWWWDGVGRRAVNGGGG